MNNIKHTLKQIVIPPNIAKFYFIRKGEAFYTITLQDGTMYQMPIPISDMGDGTFSDEIKAITVMRYVRKAIADETLVRITGRK